MAYIFECFAEKGLTVTITTEICNSNNQQNGEIYYYLDTKEEIVLVYAKEAISRIEQCVIGIAFEVLNDVTNMMDHLGVFADKLSPIMCFLVSVRVSQEYGNTACSLQDTTFTIREKLSKTSVA